MKNTEGKTVVHFKCSNCWNYVLLTTELNIDIDELIDTSVCTHCGKTGTLRIENSISITEVHPTSSGHTFFGGIRP